MSRKHSKGNPSDIFDDGDLILGLVTDSLVADTALNQLIKSINMKEAAPRIINNGKVKVKIEHKKVTVIKVVENLRYYVMIPDQLAQTLNIGLDKAKKMLRVTA